jgi:hypothetical protein
MFSQRNSTTSIELDRLRKRSAVKTFTNRPLETNPLRG